MESPRASTRSTRYVLALVLAVLPACARGSTSPDPSSPVGQTEAQPSSELPVPSGNPRAIEPPPGARLAPSSSVTASGTEWIYESHMPYGDAVGFFDRTLAHEGCESIRRTTTKTSTVWALQCRTGRAHVAVRDTGPTTVEILEASSPQP